MIGIDATLLRSGRLTGVERYGLNLLAALVHAGHGKDLFLFGSNDPSERLHELLQRTAHMGSKYGNRILTDQLWLPMALRAAKVNLLHTLVFPPPVFSRLPVVMTIHDATLWRYPETASRGGRWYYKPLYPQGLRRCKRVITVSQSSAHDLARYLGVDPAIIRVIPLAVDPVLEAAMDEAVQPPCVKDKPPYILSVGTLEPRKNLGVLLKAYTLLRAEYGVNCPLVLVGRHGWLHELPVTDAYKSDIILTGQVSDRELAGVYKGAAVYAFPSIYEGFGLPLLEAMRAGVPVVSSNAASLPEVGADACLYVDPTDPVEMAAALFRVLNEPQLAAALAAKGRARAAAYSWEQTAALTWQVYEEALG